MANTKFSDVTVTLKGSVPSISIGLGIPAVLVKTNVDAPKSKMTKFYDIQAVSDAYGPDTDMTKVARAIFSQDARPEHIDVIEYTDITNDINAFWNEDFTFALLATPNAADNATLALAIEQLAYKFAVVQVEKAADLAAFKGMQWTIGTVLPFANGRLDAAIVGGVASRTVGSVNWKFKALNGIKAWDDIMTTEKGAIDEAFGITYLTRGNMASTTGGHVMNGLYIDDLHGRIWIDSNIQSSLMNVLNQNDKVPYNAVGIGLLLGELSAVLETAFQQGIIETGVDTKGSYSVAGSTREQQTASDINSRKYSGLTFTYTPSSSIDHADVNGTVLLP